MDDLEADEADDNGQDEADGERQDERASPALAQFNSLKQRTTLHDKDTYNL